MKVEREIFTNQAASTFVDFERMESVTSSLISEVYLRVNCSITFGLTPSNLTSSSLPREKNDAHFFCNHDRK